MPIKHLTPRTRKEIALTRASMSLEEKIEEFIENTGSAMEIYMPEDERAKLYDYVINKKYKLKILSFDGFGDKEENEENYDEKVLPWIKKGWKLFWHEDNYSSQEVILIHKPIIKEDAMGGVSAPMATLNNTPGMGNVTSAGVGKIGSGDNFGVINKKPYEQSKVSSAKKKKRKKKKLVKESLYGTL